MGGVGCGGKKREKRAMMLIDNVPPTEARTKQNIPASWIKDFCFIRWFVDGISFFFFFTFSVIPGIFLFVVIRAEDLFVFI